MSTRSIFFTSLLSLCTAAPVVAIGCAAPTTTEDAEEQVAETQDELTAAASALLGTYYTHNPGTGGFARLDLKASGKYSGLLDPAGAIVCVTSPCLLPESGTWSASKKPGGGFRLRVTPTGKGSRTYDATKTGGSAQTLKLARAGVTTTLNKIAADQCLEDADCTASQECAPRMCLMYCAANDPFCCGPSTCVAKAPPPPVCTGAWLDQGGACRGLADQGLPASCCVGLSTPCGTSSCGVGEVCCNPLAGICTAPGMACAL